MSFVRIDPAHTNQSTGRLAVFSTSVDDFIVIDATPEELIEYRAEQAANKAREETRREINLVLSREAHPRPAPYYQATMTWEETAAKDRRSNAAE